jgi:hypothetical protein
VTAPCRVVTAFVTAQTRLKLLICNICDGVTARGGGEGAGEPGCRRLAAFEEANPRALLEFRGVSGVAWHGVAADSRVFLHKRGKGWVAPASRRSQPASGRMPRLAYRCCGTGFANGVLPVFQTQSRRHRAGRPLRQAGKSEQTRNAPLAVLPVPPINFQPIRGNSG